MAATQQPKNLDYYRSVLHEEQYNAFVECFEKKTNLFITGPAGVGKTFLLQCLKEYAQANGKLLFTTAMTGCAAVAIEGSTFHYYMGIGLGDLTPKEHVKKLTKDTRMRLKDTEILIVDEISMASPAFVEKCSEVLCRLRGSPKPFGGIQLILVGDFFQLPPVEKNSKTPNYIFQSRIWNQLNLTYIGLKHNHRQKTDTSYAQFLSKMRVGTLDQSDYDSVMSGIKNKKLADNLTIPHLYSRRIDVSTYNQKKLDELETEEKWFTASGKDYERMADKVPVPVKVQLKIGAKVLLCKNINVEAGLYNGTQGTIVDFVQLQPGQDLPIIELMNGTKVKIDYAVWELTKQVKCGRKYVKEVQSSFRQIPLILAYAITVHKTQGMTLEMANIHGGFFACGHAYVAFSRIKTLEGLYLEEDIPFKEIKTDASVIDFYKIHGLIC